MNKSNKKARRKPKDETGDTLVNILKPDPEKEIEVVRSFIENSVRTRMGSVRAELSAIKDRLARIENSVHLQPMDRAPSMQPTSKGE